MQAETHPFRVRATPSLGSATGKHAAEARTAPQVSEAHPARLGASNHWRPPEIPCADS